MITQQQAENMVHESLLTDYTEQEIKQMPYRVTVNNYEVIVTGDTSTGKRWTDRYKIEMMPQLILIGH